MLYFPHLFFILLGTFPTDCPARLLSPCIIEENIDLNKPCPLDFDPVCGCDHVTYSNECIASSFGLTSWIPGSCLDTSASKVERRKLFNTMWVNEHEDNLNGWRYVYKKYCYFYRDNLSLVGWCRRCSWCTRRSVLKVRWMLVFDEKRLAGGSSIITCDLVVVSHW